MDRQHEVIWNNALDAAIAEVRKLGDAEFSKLSKKGNLVIATLAQGHYLRCAGAINALKKGETNVESKKVSGAAGHGPGSGGGANASIVDQ